MFGNNSGTARLEILKDIGWCGMKKGDVIKVPSQASRKLAERWLKNGRAKLLEDKGSETKRLDMPGAEAKKNPLKSPVDNKTARAILKGEAKVTARGKVVKAGRATSLSAARESGAAKRKRLAAEAESKKKAEAAKE